MEKSTEVKGTFATHRSFPIRRWTRESTDGARIIEEEGNTVRVYSDDNYFLSRRCWRAV